MFKHCEPVKFPSISDRSVHGSGNALKVQAVDKSAQALLFAEVLLVLNLYMHGFHIESGICE